MALWHDLTQRPLLQAVLVTVVIDREVSEAFFLVNRAAQVIEHRVDNLGGRTPELITNEDVCRGQQSFAQNPVYKRLGLILTEALVDLHIVELDEAAVDILGAFRGDFGLEGHAVEGQVVDVEGEFVRRDIVAQRDLPFDFADLDLQREQGVICELFPTGNV